MTWVIMRCVCAGGHTTKIAELAAEASDAGLDDDRDQDGGPVVFVCLICYLVFGIAAAHLI